MILSRRSILMVSSFLSVTMMMGRAQQDTLPVDPVLSPRMSALIGVYEAIPVNARIPGEQRATRTALGSLPLTPAAAKAQLAARHSPDPKNLCQVLGPFRLMARPDTKFEILRDAPNKLILLFKQNSWGNVRNIRLDAEPMPVVPGFRPLWNGDAVAKWDGDTLVVNSSHFTKKTWLNEAGVVNSDQLLLVERLRLVGGGNYLEYRATATDPLVLTSPVSYTRYFKRTTSEIEEYNCFDHRPAIASARP